MSDRIPILQTPRALSAAEKRVYDRILGGDTPGTICRDLHIDPKAYIDMVQSIRSKGHDPKKEEKPMKWTDDEMAMLYAMKAEGATDLTIAEKLGRTPGQVAVKYCTMKKSENANQSTPNPAAKPIPAPVPDPEPSPVQSVPKAVIQALEDSKARLVKESEWCKMRREEITAQIKDLDTYLASIQGA